MAINFKLFRKCTYLASIWALVLFQQCVCNPVIFNYRPNPASSISDGKFTVPSGQRTELMLFGANLSNNTIIAFTEDALSCSVSEVDVVKGGNVIVSTEPGYFSPDGVSVQTGTIFIEISVGTSRTYYFCISEEGETQLTHQGDSVWLAIVVQASFLPLAAEIIFIIILMLLSGLFSGLNLGLMALDPTTLKIVMESGSKRQRLYAKIIFYVRKRGNYLLCTLLLGNVLVNSTLTVLLDSVLPGGIYAIVASTLTIVIFGEIIPQAICSRHGLVVGAWTIPLTFIFMAITFPLSFPLSLILDLILGKEIGAVYNRDQLLKLLSVTREHHDLENDEVDIIGGVLAYKNKTAKDVMTKFEDIFCIDINSVLDFKTMKLIYESGFSRVPVYEETKENIVHLLYVRDLAFVDPDDKTSLVSHVQFYNHDLLYFFEDSRLDEILKGFLDGKCHLAVIQSVVEKDGKDPEYQAVGVVTLEDIVEEILQKEIVDETDRFVDNRTFKPRAAKTVDVGAFMDYATTMSSQQKMAVFQFLSTLEPFQPQNVSGVVLKRLLNQQIVVQTLHSKDYEGPNAMLYGMNVPAKFFCLIVEGCMEVKVGKDGLIFESRSFSHFGAQALLNALKEPMPEYRPDFSAWPSSDCLVVIITQQQYRAAHKASIFEREKSVNAVSSADIHIVESKDYFSTEWAKAETSDLMEVTKSKGLGGLSSIGRYLSRSTSHDPGGKNKVKQDESSSQSNFSDHQRLLSSSSNEDASSASSPIELKEMGQKGQEAGEPVLDYDRTPNFNGGMGHRNWPSRFRTSPESSDGQSMSTEV